MPKHESILETLIRGIADRAIGVVNRYVEQIMKRVLRLAGLYLTGTVLMLLAVTFLAVGAVKWFSLIVDSWVAWAIVGIILFLIGTIAALAALLVSRS